MATERLTTAEAIVRFLLAQQIVDDRTGDTIPLVPGVFAIFGHGNALSLGEALERHRSSIRTIRGQNESAMALAAVGYAKAARRRQVMAVTTSIGPGALNTVVAAGTAMANRLPLLLLLGDGFESRDPDPVLQQLEHFGRPATSANDALRPVSRYWDKITSPSQLVSSLPQAIGVLLDPADCGPATLALPQDVQAMAYDFPAALFEPVVHHIRRPRPTVREVREAAAAIRAARQPLIIAGGGVHYSLAEAELSQFASRFGIPVMETVAGKSSLLATDASYAGPIGVFGETAGHAVAWHADAVLAVGTRLQDFTTESGTVFKNRDVQLVSINVSRFDAIKRGALSVIADARESLAELATALGDWASPTAWHDIARSSIVIQRDDTAVRIAPTDGSVPTYAQVVGAVHRVATERDYVVTSSGGLPGELVMNWASKGVATFDCEYGFSCMGYEVSGTWGAALERNRSRPDSTVYGMCGDGSFMMLPMDIYSAVLNGTNVTYVVCDNGGFNVIERLQLGHGAASFRTMLADEENVDPPLVDFVAMAAAMGAQACAVRDLTELESVLKARHGAAGVHVIVTRVAQHEWSEGSSFWEVAVPHVTARPQVDQARADIAEGKLLQRPILGRA